MRRFSPILALLIYAGCAPQPGALDPAQLLGIGSTLADPGLIPGGDLSQQPAPVAGPQPVIGDSCRGRTAVCLALKIVAYVSPDNQAPVFSQDEAVTGVRAINDIWGRCGVGFQLETFQAERAADRGLTHYVASYAELDRVRDVFADGGALLVVATGEWDRRGTIGQSSANAWTSMPGGGRYGVVLEEVVAHYNNLIAHELGHYLSLGHVNDSSSLMNPIVYSHSTSLSDSQCESVRAAAAYFWRRMYR